MTPRDSPSNPPAGRCPVSQRLRPDVGVLLGCVLAAQAGAGELRLVNGALVPGELKGIEANHIVWKADLLGDLRVEKSAVLSFDSATALAVRESHDAPVLHDCRVRAERQGAVLACAGLGTRATGLAQLRVAPPDSEWTGKVTASLNLDRGALQANDEIDVDAEAILRRGNRRHNLDASIDYEQNANRTTEDEAELLYQGDYLLQDGWYLYGLAEYRRDRQATIEESVMAGAGVGREFRPRENLYFSVQAGFGEVSLNLSEQGEETVEAATLRWKGSWQAPWRGLRLSHGGKYGFVLEDTDVNLLETQTALSMPIAGGWLGELRLDYDRYGISSGNDPKTEIEWVLGLGYRW
jgi:hypothetical protein